MATAKKSAPKKKVAAKPAATKAMAKKPTAVKKTLQKPRTAASRGYAANSRETTLVVLFAILSVAFAILAFYQYGRSY